MIYILHGENYPNSRSFITKLQQETGADSKKEVSFDEISPEKLWEICSTFDMFGNAPFVVFEISEAGRKSVDGYIEIMSKIPNETTLIVLTDKELSKSNAFIKNSQKLKAKTAVFKGPKTSNVFNFIDRVFEGSRTGAYSEYRKLILNGDDPFYVFSMMVYGLRNVAMVKLNSPGYKKMHPFVKSKAQKQAANFTSENTVYLYGEFYRLDKDSKLGNIDPEVLVPVAIEKVLRFTGK